MEYRVRACCVENTYCYFLLNRAEDLFEDSPGQAFF